ncbi:ubiquitin C-terminal hydrolase 37 [Talaromyces proteolyticus]|uniref:ubiquitinyl hydrolase 1 n=1 Tax=Talaromyces proteolyticus TaxID=1131652 RepID=A0AAD4PSH2_9EURO|nr:ubiquitin C-terminal hydrolase 37 [Talaromyces proteolyticus]KAH8688890.1 ubiquitin C-terminal hydrolase 37 [Talaromyces proteolyticus]
MRRRNRLATSESSVDTATNGMATLSGLIERQSWNGFCEIESEPSLFNVMLREFGVEGVNVQEVVSLDKEIMDLLPHVLHAASLYPFSSNLGVFYSKPVYGLIFLFRWQEDNPEKQEASCPDGVWFANQTASNACASVALLNIVNNIEGIRLGDNLTNFKNFTMPFTPALRGDAVANFEFVKRIHNSFARSMDILNSDLLLKDEAKNMSSKGKKHEDNESSEAGFHFIAFVPAKGRVWKFDGLERQPQDLAPCTDDDWLDQVRAHLISRIEGYEEDQIEFSVLSLVRDPLRARVEKLALNVRRLQAIRTCFTTSLRSSAEETLGDAPGIVLLGPDTSLGLTQDILDLVGDPRDEIDTYNRCSCNELSSEYSRLVVEQQDILMSIREEMQSRQSDDENAEGRRHDYSSAVEYWARALIQKGNLRELIE